MTYPVHYVPAGDVLPIFFDTYDGGTGASLTMSGLAVTDIEIYKDGSVTQRASDAGYTLLDTDGIDFDGLTGIHGFSIDTGDNTDASFYTVGAWFHVVVSAITVDAQTVSFIAAAFRLMAAEDSAGVPDVNVTHFGGSAGTFSGGRPEVNTTHAAGTAWGSGAITAGAIANGAIDAATFAADVDAEILSYLVDDATRIDASALNTASGTSIPAILEDTGTTLQGELDGIQADTEDIQTKIGTPSVSLAADIATIDDFLDTEVAAILADTNELQTDWVNGGRLDLLIDAIKAKTDSLTFTVANQVDANALTIDEDEILDDPLADSVPADGALPTVRQALYMLVQFLTERSVSGTTVTVKKVDGSTSLMTFTLDDGTNPTSITRVT